MRMDLLENKSIDIDTGFLKIRGNCLEMKNTTIQLSNISLFSTADLVPNKFPLLSVGLILLGLLLLEESIVVFALILLIIGAILLYFWYSSVKEIKKMRRLTIVTNSGKAFSVVFKDKTFLADVISVLTDIIRDPSHVRDITVNISECKFEGSSSVVQNMYER